MRYLKLVFLLSLALTIACQSNGVGLPTSTAPGGELETREPDAGAQALALIPTPTPALTDLSPFDGDSKIYYSGGSALNFEAAPANLEGNGIGYVDLYIMGANGARVDSRTENNEPYCYYSPSDNECSQWVFADHNFKWRGGSRATDGIYFARALAYNRAGNKLRVEEKPFWVILNNTFSPTADVNIEAIGSKFSKRNKNNNHPEYKDELEFRATAADDSGLPLDRVDMMIVAPDGSIVSRTSDSTSPYCGFGDAGGGSCKRWVFNQHGNQWPGGAPIRQRMYTFRTVAFLGGIAVGATSETYTILAPQSASAQPNKPPPGNSSSGCCATLADGVNDVDQVSRRLVFRTFAGANGHEGDDIERVEMSIEDDTGRQVHQRDEQSPRYCAFGGNEECNAFTFANENEQWDNGDPIQDNGQYTLIATVRFRSGRAPLRLSREITVHLR